jgi:hypothetical protein
MLIFGFAAIGDFSRVDQPTRQLCIRTYKTAHTSEVRPLIGLCLVLNRYVVSWTKADGLHASDIPLSHLSYPRETDVSIEYVRDIHGTLPRKATTPHPFLIILLHPRRRLCPQEPLGVDE